MQFSRFLSRATGRLTGMITIAFGVLLLGMIAATLNGLWQNERLLDNLDEVIERRSENVQLTTDLLEAAYNRHQSLVNQVLTDDPFERDALRMQFDSWGNRVGEVRSRLRLRLKSPGALNYLDEQDALIPEIVTLQEQIVRLAADERVPEAMALLRARLFELDRAFDQVIEQLRAYERQKMEAAMSQARSVGQESRRFLIQSGIGGLLFAIGLMWLTLRTLAGLRRDVRDQALQIEAANAQLEFDATHDALTGLANRRAFWAFLAGVMNGQNPSSGTKAWLLAYIDLNDFKPVNDRLGHVAGDRLLSTMADRLAEFAATRGAFAARLGGDEFALLHPADHPEAEQLADQLGGLLGAPVDLGTEAMIRLAPSIGLARWPGDADDPDGLIHAADTRMYAHKAASKRGRAG